MTELIPQSNKYQNRLEQSMKIAGYDDLDDSTKKDASSMCAKAPM